jgi:hypothetical protein
MMKNYRHRLTFYDIDKYVGSPSYFTGGTTSKSKILTEKEFKDIALNARDHNGVMYHQLRIITINHTITEMTNEET